MSRTGGRRAALAVLVVLLAGCGSDADPGARADGPLGSNSQPGTGVDCVPATGSPDRTATISIWQVRPEGTTDSTLTGVTLAGGDGGVTLLEAHVARIGDGTPIGVTSHYPPSAAWLQDPRVASTWAGRRPVAGAVVRAGVYYDLVLGLRLAAGRTSASFDHAVVHYSAGGEDFVYPTTLGGELVTGSC